MSLKQIVKDIRTVRIQGAQRIAFAALEALNQTVHRSRATTQRQLLKELYQAKNQLDSVRATEPLLRNYTSGALHDIDTSSLRELRESVLANIAKLRKEHKNHLQEIIHIGEQKIPRGATIFTHCHSSTVTGILKLAHKKKKRIMVTNTEARPIYQGRITARELSAAGIRVHHFVDSAAHIALEHADLMLIGADAITPYGVLNKIGSELFAQTAKHMRVPVYVCTHALKLDPKTIKGKKEPVEQRDKKEVWDRAPHRVTIHNPAFEVIEPQFIDGIISELGIFPFKAFIREVKRAYPWVFEK